MPFADPAGGFFSPSMPNTSPENIGSRPLAPLPNIANINPPSAQPFQTVQPIRYQPDETAGTAIKGVGEVLQTTLGAADAVLKSQISDKVSKGYEGIMNSQLQAGKELKDQVLSEDNTQSKDNTPTSVSQGLDRMGTLEKAKRSGAVSDTQFGTQLNDLAAGLKMNYPGYVDVINQKIKEVTGKDPADFLRKSYQADVTQLNADRLARQSRTDTIIAKYGKYAALEDPDFMQHMSPTQIQAIGIKYEAKQAKTEMIRADMAMQNEQGTLKAETVADHVRTESMSRVADINNAFTRDIQKRTNGKTLSEFLAQGTVGPTQLREVIGSLGSLRDNANRSFENVLQTPMSDTDPTTYRNVLARGKGNEYIEQLRKQTLAPIDSTIDALTNKDYGLASMNERYIKEIDNYEKAGLAQKYPAYKRLQIMTNGMDSAFNAKLANDPTIVGLQGRMVNDYISFGFFTQPGQSFSDTIKTAQNDGNANFQAPDYNRFIEMARDGITMNNSKDIKENSARGIFLDKDPGYFIQQLPAAQQMGIFTRLASPDVAAQVKNMSPEVQQGYNQWVRSNFGAIYRRVGDEINAQNSKSPYFNVNMDPASGHFVLTPTPKGMQLGDKYGEQIADINPSISRINAGIDILKPVVEASGQDFKEYMKTLRGGLTLNDDQLQKNPDQVSLTTLQGQRLPLAQYGQRRGTEMDTIPQNHPLLNLIRKGENASSYDGMYADNKAKVTGMTVDELMSAQDKSIADQRAKGTKSDEISSASGAYQFMRNTMTDIKKGMSLKGDEKLTPELQDNMARWLLERRGLSKVKSGQMSKYDFVNNLSQEWAALPNMQGKGSYDGVGKNKSNIPLVDLLQAVDKL